MATIRRSLARRFPEASLVYKSVRSRVHRLVRGEGEVGVFDRVNAENLWQDPESASGSGSSLHQTETLRRELPALLRRLGVRSLLDAPCGDFNWMRLVELGDITYTGVDMVSSLVERCGRVYAGSGRRFETRNIITDPLPRADAILSRDCLNHLSYEPTFAALGNFRATGATFLLATTYTSRDSNWDIVTGSWRPMNLEVKPFAFPPMLDRIIEGSTEFDGDFVDKTLAAWRLDSLPLG